MEVCLTIYDVVPTSPLNGNLGKQDEPPSHGTLKY